jgi:hypothetical protein
MGGEIFVLTLPGVLLLAVFIPWRLTPTSQLFSKQRGPILSTDALHQLTTLILLYFVLFMVPIAGRLMGEWGQLAALGTLFVVFLSLLIRFKKLSDG